MWQVCTYSSSVSGHVIFKSARSLSRLARSPAGASKTSLALRIAKLSHASQSQECPGQAARCTSILPAPQARQGSHGLEERVCHALPTPPYTRHGASTTKSRRDRVHWARTMAQLLRADDDAIVRMLTFDGILEDKAGTRCPHCHAGVLSDLVTVPKRGLRYRCRRKGCQKFVTPAHGHLILSCGSGPQMVPLQEQAATLFCAVADAQVRLAHN